MSTGRSASDEADPRRARRRAHTGRRRSPEARAAILEAVQTLLAERGVGGLSIETIASAAGVGRQTIYRWWPTKGAVVLDAMLEGAEGTAPVPATGTLRGDLDEFLRATFQAAGATTMRRLLCSAMAAAQTDQAAAETMRAFTDARRRALRQILETGRRRGEIPPTANLALLVDQAYGLLWYRLLVGHASVDAGAAAELTDNLLTQAAGGERQTSR